MLVFCDVLHHDINPIHPVSSKCLIPTASLQMNPAHAARLTGASKHLVTCRASFFHFTLSLLFAYVFHASSRTHVKFDLSTKCAPQSVWKVCRYWEILILTSLLELQCWGVVRATITESIGNPARQWRRLSEMHRFNHKRLYHNRSVWSSSQGYLLDSDKMQPVRILVNERWI